MSKMITGIIFGLISGVILSLFNVDKICIEVLQPFTSIELTEAHYYFVFGALGLISFVFNGNTF
jgi:hypothetical protein